MKPVIYSVQADGFDENATYHNPRYFRGKIEAADEIIVIGDWPDIVAAYRDAGREVIVRNSIDAPEQLQQPESAKPEIQYPASGDHEIILSNRELIDIIAEATGKTPHGNTNRATLIEMYNNLATE